MRRLELHKVKLGNHTDVILIDVAQSQYTIIQIVWKNIFVISNLKQKT